MTKKHGITRRSTPALLCAGRVSALATAASGAGKTTVEVWNDPECKVHQHNQGKQ